MKKQFLLFILLSCIFIKVTAQDKDLSSNNKSIIFHGNSINISQISNLLNKQISWIECVDACRNLNEGGYSDWHMPSFEEAIFYRTSNSIKVPDNWGVWIWTTTPWDARTCSVPGPNNWVVFGETLGTWDNENRAQTQG